MIEYSVTVDSLTTSEWVRLGTGGRSIHLYSIMIDIENEGGACADLEFALQKDLTNPTAITHHVLKDITRTTASLVQGPMTAVRLNIQQYYGGTITLRVLQS